MHPCHPPPLHRTPSGGFGACCAAKRPFLRSNAHTQAGSPPPRLTPNEGCAPFPRGLQEDGGRRARGSSASLRPPFVRSGPPAALPRPRPLQPPPSSQHTPPCDHARAVLSGTKKPKRKVFRCCETAADTDGGWTPTDGGWRTTDGGWRATDGGWRTTDGGWRTTDGGWRTTDGGWSLWENALKSGPQ